MTTENGLQTVSNGYASNNNNKLCGEAAQYVRDRQTDIRLKHCLMPPPNRGGHNNNTNIYSIRRKMSTLKAECEAPAVARWVRKAVRRQYRNRCLTEQVSFKVAFEGF